MADIKDEQWRLIEFFIPKTINGALRGHLPRDPREVLNGIFWIMGAGRKIQSNKINFATNILFLIIE